MAIRRQVQVHHGSAKGVHLRNFRRVGLGGQLVHDAGNAVANVIGGPVDIARHAELHPNVGTFVAAVGGQFFNPLDTGDHVLDHLGHLGLDNFGRGAAVTGLDRHHRRLDVRILAHRQATQRCEAQDHQQSRNNRGEDRPADRFVRDDHGSRAFIRRGWTGFRPAAPDVLSACPR